MAANRKVRVRFEGAPIGVQFKKNMIAQRDRMNRSLFAAANDFAREFLAAGRQNIAKAGNFKSARWMQGLFADVTRGGGNIVISIGHKVPYWIVFQEGRVIRGKPLLWIPLSFAPDAKLAGRAKNFPGGLFRVDRKNGLAPLLFSRRDRRPKYFGKRSVRIPKKFRVLEIGRQLSKKIGDFYHKRFAADKGK
jgi:hypothetical protein